MVLGTLTLIQKIPAENFGTILSKTLKYIHHIVAGQCIVPKDIYWKGKSFSFGKLNIKYALELISLQCGCGR